MKWTKTGMGGLPCVTILQGEETQVDHIKDENGPGTHCNV